MPGGVGLVPRPMQAARAKGQRCSGPFWPTGRRCVTFRPPTQRPGNGPGGWARNVNRHYRSFQRNGRHMTTGGREGFRRGRLDVGGEPSRALPPSGARPGQRHVGCLAPGCPVPLTRLFAPATASRPGSGAGSGARSCPGGCPGSSPTSAANVACPSRWVAGMGVLPGRSRFGRGDGSSGEGTAGSRDVTAAGIAVANLAVASRSRRG